MKYNYHTHTSRCNHAKNIDDEAYVVAAIEAGFEVLAFTDHVPFGQLDFEEDLDRMRLNEVADYLSSIHSLQKKYGSQIRILSGFEIEYYPQFISHYQKLREMSDILILGQHYRYPISHDYGIESTDEDVGIYASQIEQCLESGLVDIVAHPDYFMLGRSEWNQACSDAAHRICRAASHHQIPLEINLNGLRYGKKNYDGCEKYPYPFDEFWKIASGYGCRALYGFDAHDPATLTEDWRIEEANRIVTKDLVEILDGLNT